MEGKRKGSWRRWAVIALLAGGVACGPVVEPIPTETAAGPACTRDDECVPNACCGDGTRAVHVSQAPQCGAVQCSARCPPGQVDCGCGLPVCRNGHCAVAYTFGPTCP